MITAAYIPPDADAKLAMSELHAAISKQQTALPHLGQSDHLSLFLTPKYSPLINRVKPSVRTIKVWPAGVDSTLQDRFQHTDWSMFASQATCGSHTDIDSYTASVLDYINITTDSVTTQKQITT
ncbi:MAG: hypothetical protein ACRC41_16790 [Sarcina sp.]